MKVYKCFTQKTLSTWELKFFEWFYDLFSWGSGSLEVEALVEEGGSCLTDGRSYELQRDKTSVKMMTRRENDSVMCAISAPDVPCMRAAICRLFWEGMSLTVSSAVRFLLSTIFTSIPEEHSHRSSWLQICTQRTGNLWIYVDFYLCWVVFVLLLSFQIELLHEGHCLSLSVNKHNVLDT